MNESEISDINEMKILILKLNKTFTDKLLDQAYIIKQQQKRLDTQQQQLHEQRAIIDELAWQIRDVRDTLRKYSEQTQSKNHVECPENHLKINIPNAKELKQSNHVSGRKLFSFLHSFVSFGNFHFVIEHNLEWMCAICLFI